MASPHLGAGLYPGPLDVQTGLSGGKRGGETAGRQPWGEEVRPTLWVAAGRKGRLNAFFLPTVLKMVLDMYNEN